MQASSGVQHEHWSSRLAFVLAAIGSAVGLGNLWRFPYEAGENGGGAFVLIYVLCVIFIGLPVLMSEFFIGRRGQASAVLSVVRVVKEQGHPAIWSLAAWFGMLGATLILTFYSMIAGWVIAYVFTMIGEIFSNIASSGLGGLSQGAFVGETDEEIGARLTNLLNDPWGQTALHAAFMGLTIFIVAQGVKGGIEKTVELLMPAFFVMLIVLVGYSITAGDTSRATEFLFAFDFNKLSAEVFISALGQAFFSIGLGSALMITYGAYMDKSVNIPRSSVIIAGADTGVAILAGLAIFPIVFAAGLDPQAGPTLMFQSLPIAFSNMPFGALFGLAFFLLALFAAVTSSIALLEASVSYVEDNIGGHRATAAIIMGAIVFIIGMGSVLSNNMLANFYPLDFIGLFEGDTIFGIVDDLTGKVLLPLSGLLVSLIAGWVVTRDAAREELGLGEFWFKAWRSLVRYVAPIAVSLVLAAGIFPEAMDALFNVFG